MKLDGMRVVWCCALSFFAHHEEPGKAAKLPAFTLYHMCTVAAAISLVSSKGERKLEAKPIAIELK